MWTQETKHQIRHRGKWEELPVGVVISLPEAAALLGIGLHSLYRYTHHAATTLPLPNLTVLRHEKTGYAWGIIRHS